jgi:hypothetical protein
LVFAFFPQHISQTFEHVHLASLQFMPLTLFFFNRLCRDGEWRNAVGTGVCFALNALCSWHLGLHLMLALLPFVAMRLLHGRRRLAALLPGLTLATAVALLMLLPAVAPLAADMLGGETYFQKPSEERGIDPAFLFVPHFGHPLWGSLTAPGYVDRAYGEAGFVCYVGFVPSALAIFALARRQRDALYWGLFSIATLVLALGAHPYWKVRYVPVLSLLRTANRFLALTSLGLAVLTGLAWVAMRNRTDGKFVLLAALIFFEFAWVPYPIRQLAVSPVYEQLARSGRPGAILDIPSLQRSRSAHNMVAQTVHKRPIAGGYVATRARRAEEIIAQDPVLSDLMGVPQLQRPIDRDHLIALGFDTVVLHKYRADSYARQWRARVPPTDILEYRYVRRLGGVPDDTMRRVRQELTTLCGRPALEDSEVVVFYLDEPQSQDNS